MLQLLKNLWILEDFSYPSIFKIIENSNDECKLASFVSWKPINSGIIERSVKMDEYSPMLHENWIDRSYLYMMHHVFKKPIYDEYLVKQLLNYLRNNDNKKLKLLFVHLTDIDEIGHIYGFNSSQYLEQIKKTDNYLEIILRTISELNWPKNILRIITTDHGGIGKSHGGESDQEVNVFLSISGEGIVPCLIESEITNMDCAAIVLKALGVEIPKNFDAELPEAFKRKMNEVK